MTIGSCVISRSKFDLIGMWKIGPRELKLDTMSRKRIIPDNARLKKQRSGKLVALDVNHWVNSAELSAASVPEWLSEGNRIEREADEDSMNVVAGLSQ